MADLVPLTRGQTLPASNAGGGSSVDLTTALNSQTGMITELQKIATSLEEIKKNQVSNSNKDVANTIVAELKKTADKEYQVNKGIQDKERQLREKELQITEKNLQEIKKGIETGFSNTWKGFQELGKSPIGFVEDALVGTVKTLYNSFFEAISPDKDKFQVEEIKGEIEELKENGNRLLDAYRDADDEMRDSFETIGDKFDNAADRIVESIEKATDDIVSTRAKEFANEFLEAAADFNMSMQDMGNYGMADDVGYVISDDNANVQDVDLAAESGVEVPAEEEQKPDETKSLEGTVSNFAKNVLKGQKDGIKSSESQTTKMGKGLKANAASMAKRALSAGKASLVAGLAGVKAALIAFVIIVFLPAIVNFVAKWVVPFVRKLWDFFGTIVSWIKKIWHSIVDFFSSDATKAENMYNTYRDEAATSKYGKAYDQLTEAQKMAVDKDVYKRAEKESYLADSVFHTEGGKKFLVGQGTYIEGDRLVGSGAHITSTDISGLDEVVDEKGGSQYKKNRATNMMVTGMGGNAGSYKGTIAASFGNNGYADPRIVKALKIMPNSVLHDMTGDKTNFGSDELKELSEKIVGWYLANEEEVVTRDQMANDNSSSFVEINTSLRDKLEVGDSVSDDEIASAWEKKYGGTAVAGYRPINGEDRPVIIYYNVASNIDGKASEVGAAVGGN